MNAIIKLGALSLALLLTSCFKANLEPLPNATDAEIVSVNKVSYRWVAETVNPASGEKNVLQRDLRQGAKVDKENHTIEIKAQVPDGFPKDVAPQVSREHLVVSLNLSSAARIAPAEGAPLLGIPGDWSKPNRYVVTAGDGTAVTWTITLELVK